MFAMRNAIVHFYGTSNNAVEMESVVVQDGCVYGIVTAENKGRRKDANMVWRAYPLNSVTFIEWSAGR